MSGPARAEPRSDTLTVLSGNLLAGGVGRSRAETRFAGLMAVAGSHRPDVFAAQECLYWDEKNHALLHEAERVLGMHAVLGIAPDSRMHTAVFVRPPLRIAQHRFQQGGIWHHSVTHAVVVWDGPGGAPAGRLRLASLHLSPRNPARRLVEAGELTDYASSALPALLLGDTNTQDETTDLSAASPDALVRFARSGTTIPDTAPINLLLDAGMLDLAATGPGGVAARTTGHWPGKPVRGRPDRALGNRAAAAAVRAFRVVTDAREFTDHDWTLLEIDRAALAEPTRDGR